MDIGKKNALGDTTNVNNNTIGVRVSMFVCVLTEKSKRGEAQPLGKVNVNIYASVVSSIPI